MLNPGAAAHLACWEDISSDHPWITGRADLPQRVKSYIASDSTPGAAQHCATHLLCNTRPFWLNLVAQPAHLRTHHLV